MMLDQLVTRYQTFLWFAAIGAFSGSVYFICLFYLLDALALDYRLAVSIAYLVALSCHFGANRQITFRGLGGSVYVHIMRYSIMVGLNYLTTMVIVIAAVNLAYVSVYIGAMVAIGFNLIINYWLSKHWIFRNQSLPDLHSLGTE